MSLCNFIVSRRRREKLNYRFRDAYLGCKTNQNQTKQTNQKKKPMRGETVVSAEDGRGPKKGRAETAKGWRNSISSICAITQVFVTVC